MDYKEIESICERYQIKNWSIEDGLVNVDGDVDFYNKGTFDKLPLRFGKVSGYFRVINNRLVTLKGAPYYVGKSFDCSHNRLTSLEFAPGYIDYSFFCNNNRITTLKGAPNHVGNSFHCYHNKLYDVYDFEGNFVISHNPVASIYNYISINDKLVVSMDYFKDCKILIGRDIHISRFKYFLDSYGLYSNIHTGGLKSAGYNIK